MTPFESRPWVLALCVASALISCASPTDETVDECMAESVKELGTKTAAVRAFYSFVGLSLGDKRFDVVRIFGVPEREMKTDSGDAILTYLHGALEIWIDSRSQLVEAVHLTNGYALVGGAGIHEPKADLLGHDAAGVFETLGRPSDLLEAPGFYTYSDHDGKKSVYVSFWCYESQQCQCAQISVAWYSDSD